MRTLAVSLTLLLAACSQSAANYSVDDVVGHYRLSHGGDTWNELDLMP